MKKFIKTFVFAIMAIAVPIMVSSCSCSGGQNEVSLRVNGIKYVFNVGEEFTLGERASVLRAQGGTETTLSSNDYSITHDFDGSAEGIYSVSVTAGELSYSYSVVVIDYDNLTAEERDTLADVILPANLNLSWKEPSTDVGSIGTNNFTAVFSPNSSTSIEVSLPVIVRERIRIPNAWVIEPAIDNWVYGDVASIPFGEALDGTVEFRYYSDESCEEIYRLMTAPAVSGTYYMVAYVPEGDVYAELVSEPIEFKIEKVIVTINRLSQETISKSYDGGYAYDGESLIGTYLAFDSAYNLDLSNLAVNISATFVDGAGRNFSNVGACIIRITLSLDEDDVNGGMNYAFMGGPDGVLSTTISLDAEITEATATVSQNPVASEITTGHTLGESVISGGAVSAMLVTSADSTSASLTEIEGTWAWSEPSQVVSGSGTYEAIFTPSDANISPVTEMIEVEVIPIEVVDIIDESNITYAVSVNSNNEFNISEAEILFDGVTIMTINLPATLVQNDNETQKVSLEFVGKNGFTVELVDLSSIDTEGSEEPESTLIQSGLNEYILQDLSPMIGGQTETMGMIIKINMEYPLYTAIIFNYTPIA